MELNPYKIMDFMGMKLDDSEYMEAYRLWQNIKHNILSEFTESWLQSGGDKVKQFWEESE